MRSHCLGSVSGLALFSPRSFNRCFSIGSSAATKARSISYTVPTAAIDTAPINHTSVLSATAAFTLPMVSTVSVARFAITIGAATVIPTLYATAHASATRASTG